MTEKRRIFIEDPIPLDEEERETMEALERALDFGEVVSTLTPEGKALVEASARATTNPKRKSVTARLPERDLVRLKSRALEKGMPYQTLLATILHQYLEGTLKEEK